MQEVDLRPDENLERVPVDWETYYKEFGRAALPDDPREVVVPPELTDAAQALASPPAPHQSTKPLPHTLVFAVGSAVYAAGIATGLGARPAVRAVKSLIKNTPRAAASSLRATPARARCTIPIDTARSAAQVREAAEVHRLMRFGGRTTLGEGFDSSVMEYGRSIPFAPSDPSSCASSFSLPRIVFQAIKSLNPSKWWWADAKPLAISQATEAKSDDPRTEKNDGPAENIIKRPKTHIIPEKPAIAPLPPPRSIPTARARPVALQQALSVSAVETHVADYGFIKDHADLPPIRDPCMVEFRILNIPRGRPPHRFQRMRFTMKVKGGAVLRSGLGCGSSAVARRVAKFDHLYELEAKYYRANGQNLLKINGSVWDCKRDMRQQMLYPLRQLRRADVERYDGVGKLRAEEKPMPDSLPPAEIPKLNLKLHMTAEVSGGAPPTGDRPPAPSATLNATVTASICIPAGAVRDRQDLKPPRMPAPKAPPPIRYSRTDLALRGVSISPFVHIPFSEDSCRRGSYILKLDGKVESQQGRSQGWSAVLIEESIWDGIGLDDDAYLPNLRPSLRKVVKAASVFVRVESDDASVPRSVWIEGFGPTSGFELRPTNEGVCILHLA